MRVPEEPRGDGGGPLNRYRCIGEATVLEAALFGLGDVNSLRARHDLRTLARGLPDGVEDPLEQLDTLGESVGAAFAMGECCDVGRVLLERSGDEFLVAMIIATVGQSVGWDVAVVASDRRALIGHRRCGPPLALSVADEGRMIDANDLAGEGDLWWCCPQDVARLVRRRATVRRAVS